MNRHDFIFQLFDNGNGLTLDQIQQIEDNLPLLFPDSVDSFLASKAAAMGLDADEPPVWESALSDARTVFMDDLQDCADLLELRSFLRDFGVQNVQDMQVYHIMYAVA